MKPEKVMIVLGTRPEAIKLAPLILAMQRDRGRFEPYVLATGQHDEMMGQVLEAFQIQPEQNLEIMTAGQTLSDITTRALLGIESVLMNFCPDLVLVQGDTTTAFVAALAAFYHQVPVGHVEAGLRTHHKFNPYPEEMNRRLISSLADLHFAPTALSARRLQAEGIPPETVFVTGNTVIDALLMSVRKAYLFQNDSLNTLKDGTKKVLVVTLHRRESFGDPMRSILRAIGKIADDFKEIEVVFPVHLNPEVRNAVEKTLGAVKRKNIHLVDPLGYLDFVHMMNRAYLILTDSGGIQEEAPSLGKPVLVLRDTTERPEGIEAGCARLVGTRPDHLYNAARELIENPLAYEKMARSANPYGDGRSAARILNILHEVNTDGSRFPFSKTKPKGAERSDLFIRDRAAR